MFNKLRESLKSIFETNRCRFSKECEHYREDSNCCNSLYARFTDDKAYCGTYRKFDE